jgi:D-arabinose 1-dehydrogenase-like Zn-dependent alcohol dehydrogenase
VTTRKKGDRVGVPWVQKTCGRCEWCQRGKRLFCEQQQGTGVTLHGGHAEYMLAYADALSYCQTKYHTNKLHQYFVLGILYIVD